MHYLTFLLLKILRALESLEKSNFESVFLLDLLLIIYWVFSKRSKVRVGGLRAWNFQSD